MKYHGLSNHAIFPYSPYISMQLCVETWNWCCRHWQKQLQERSRTLRFQAETCVKSGVKLSIERKIRDVSPFSTPAVLMFLNHFFTADFPPSGSARGPSPLDRPQVPEPGACPWGPAIRWGTKLVGCRCVFETKKNVCVECMGCEEGHVFMCFFKGFSSQWDVGLSCQFGDRFGAFMELHLCRRWDRPPGREKSRDSFSAIETWTMSLLDNFVDIFQLSNFFSINLCFFGVHLFSHQSFHWYSWNFQFNWFSFLWKPVWSTHTDWSLICQEGGERRGGRRGSSVFPISWGHQSKLRLIAWFDVPSAWVEWTFGLEWLKREKLWSCDYVYHSFNLGIQNIEVQQVSCDSCWTSTLNPSRCSTTGTSQMGNGQGPRKHFAVPVCSNIMEYIDIHYIDHEAKHRSFRANLFLGLPSGYLT